MGTAEETSLPEVAAAMVIRCWDFTARPLGALGRNRADRWDVSHSL